MASTLDYKALFARTPNLYAVLDRALRFVDASDAYLAATCSRREELIGRNAFETFPHDPDDPSDAGSARLRASLERVLETGETEVLTFFCIRVPGPDGPRERFWSGSHTAIRDASGQVAFVLQHIIDVTELRRDVSDQKLRSFAPIEAGLLGRAQVMEERSLALGSELRHFKELFERFPGFMCFLRGPDFVIELANAAAWEVVGPGRPLIGRPLLEALPELREQPFPALLERVARERKTFVGRDMVIRIARGAGVPLQAVYVNFIYHPVIDDLGRLSGIMVLGFDATQERAAQLEAKLSRKRLERVIEASGAGIWELDVSSGAIRLDERATALLDARQRVYASLQALYEQVVDPEDIEHVADAIQSALKGQRGGHYMAAYRLRGRPGGNERWIEARGRVTYDTRGAPSSFEGTIIDITERMELLRRERASRAEAERANRLKDEFLAAVSHELRTPLTAILGWLHLLRTTQLNPEKRARAIAVIEANARLQARLIDNLLDSSRIISGKLTLDTVPVDLRMVVDNAIDSVRPLAEGRQVQISVEIDPSLRTIAGDSKRLQQVLWNLLSNAVKFSPVGGRVEIIGEQKGPLILLRVRDQGVGISADFLPKVFDRFSTNSGAGRRQGGLGLGLSISKHIVEAHGGTIALKSPGHGQGTTVIVTLPNRRRIEASQPNSSKIRQGGAHTQKRPSPTAGGGGSRGESGR